MPTKIAKLMRRASDMVAFWEVIIIRGSLTVMN